MPLPLPLKASGALRPFDAAEVRAMRVQTRSVREGRHPTETRRRGMSSTSRAFFCKWDQRWKFLIHMLGAAVIFPDGLATPPRDRLSRLPPQRHPDPEGLDLYAVALESLTGHDFIRDDPATGMPVYQKAECVFQYEILPFGVVGDDLVSAEWSRYVETLPSQAQSDVLLLPGGTYKYVRPGGARPDGLPIPYNFGKIESQSVVRYKWHRVPELAWGPGRPLYKRVFGDLEAGKKGYCGTVNKTGFINRAPGTLLLENVEEELYPSVLGAGREWDLTFVFRHKPTAPWNSWYFFETNGAATNNGYYFVSVDGNSYTTDTLPDDKSVYNAREFQNLFEVGTLAGE